MGSWRAVAGLLCLVGASACGKDTREQVSSDASGDASSALPERVAPAARSADPIPLSRGVPAGATFVLDLPPTKHWGALLPSHQLAGFGKLVDGVLEPVLARMGLTRENATALFGALGPSLAFGLPRGGWGALSDLDEPSAFDGVLESGAFKREAKSGDWQRYGGRGLFVARKVGSGRALIATSAAHLELMIATLRGDKPAHTMVVTRDPNEAGKLVGHADLAALFGGLLGPGSQLKGHYQAEPGKGLRASIESSWMGEKVPDLGGMLLPVAHGLADRLPSSTGALISMSIKRAPKTKLGDIVRALVTPLASEQDLKTFETDLRELIGLDLAALDKVVGDSAVIAVVEDPAQPSDKPFAAHGGFDTRRAGLLMIALKDPAAAGRSMTKLKALLDQDTGQVLPVVPGGFRVDKSLLETFVDAELYVQKDVFVVAFGAPAALSHARNELAAGTEGLAKRTAWQTAKKFYGDDAHLVSFFPDDEHGPDRHPMVTRYTFESLPGGARLRLESVNGYELVLLPVVALGYEDLAKKLGF